MAGNKIKLLPINDISVVEGKIAQRIAKPGIYRMPITIYHSDCAATPSISSGDIYQLGAKSGREYYVNSYYNPDRDDPYSKANQKKYQGHFSFGGAAHAFIVGGAKFEDEYAIRPKHMKNWRSDAAKIWRWEKIVRQNQKVITYDEIEHVKRMADVIMENEQARTLFAQGLPELSMFIKIGDVWIKARPDVTPIAEFKKRPGRFYITDTVISDFKVIYDNAEYLCKKQINDYGYAHKLANVAYIQCKLFGLDFSTLSFVLIFQKSTPPHDITPVELDRQDMFLLLAENLAGVRRFSQGMAPMGHFEGYDYAEMPKFRLYDNQRARIEKKIETGEYPNLDGNLNIIEG